VAGTRTLKDWQLASDLGSRAARYDRWHDKRLSTWNTDVYRGVSLSGPVVRSTLGPQSPDRKATSMSWHEELVKYAFSNLEKTVKGEVGLDQLEASFATMQIPIDGATFIKYACQLLPFGADCVNFEEFVAFHKAVWANQPASVRRFAGDPATSGSAAFTGSEANRRLLRSSSVPSGASLRELRDNEGMLRSAFKRYERSPGYLERGQLPALFQDVGLDLGINSDLGMQGSNRLNMFLNSEFKSSDIEGKDKVSLHEVVEMQNKYIATLEGQKNTRTSQSEVFPTFSADNFIRESMQSALVSRPGTAVKREAALQEKVAMIGAFRGVSSLSPEEVASKAEQVKALARDALQAALFGDDDEEESEVKPPMDVDQLRASAKGILLNGISSGRLETALANTKPPAAKMDVDQLRNNAKGILLGGIASGKLDEAFASVR